MPEIRPAAAGDAAAIVALLRQLGYDLDPAAAAALAVELLDDPAHVLLVAVEDGEVVGFANANLRRQLHHLGPVCTLDELVVADGRRSGGIGAALVAELERVARERGADSLELTCNRRRADAHRFYEREGFERTSFKFAKRP
ncbi:MAG TPA: GNAT family N-acetyltransferase [Gaiellaceae bacterium]|nr:GNAT family N-acetyltransferase [Gaiellaceae bacterium]